MRRLDIDIERRRVEILRRQQEAIRPFQEELRKLAILDEMVNGEPQAKPSVEKKPKRAKANGHLPYAGRTQPEALRLILAKEPGLMVSEITERMVEGGFPFTTPKPKTSVYTLVRGMTKTGELKMTKPEYRGYGENGRERQSNRYRLN